MSSVDLPLPDGPTRLSDSPASTLRLDAPEDMDLSGPGPEADMNARCRR